MRRFSIWMLTAFVSVVKFTERVDGHWSRRQCCWKQPTRLPPPIACGIRALTPSHLERIYWVMVQSFEYEGAQLYDCPHHLFSVFSWTPHFSGAAQQNENNSEMLMVYKLPEVSLPLSSLPWLCLYQKGQVCKDSKTSVAWGWGGFLKVVLVYTFCPTTIFCMYILFKQNLVLNGRVAHQTPLWEVDSIVPPACSHPIHHSLHKTSSIKSSCLSLLNHWYLRIPVSSWMLSIVVISNSPLEVIDKGAIRESSCKRTKHERLGGLYFVGLILTACKVTSWIQFILQVISRRQHSISWSVAAQVCKNSIVHRS